MNHGLKEYAKGFAKAHDLNANIVALIINYLSDDINPRSTPSVTATLMINEVQPMLDAEGTSWSELDYYHWGYGELVYDCAKAQAAGVVENRHTKKILKDCFSFPYVGYDIVTYCRETGILNEADGDELLELVKQAMIDNPRAVDELRSGKDKAIGALVGAVMKKQKASPVEIQKIIRDLL